MELKTRNLEKLSNDVQEKKQELIDLENELFAKKESIKQELNELSKKTAQQKTTNEEHDTHLLSNKKQELQNEISNLTTIEASLRETISMMQTSKCILEDSLNELMQNKNYISEQIKKENESFKTQQHQHNEVISALQIQVSSLKDLLQTLENKQKIIDDKNNISKNQCVDVATNTKASFIAIKPENEFSQNNTEEMLNEDKKSPLSLKDLEKETGKVRLVFSFCFSSFFWEFLK